MSAARLSAPPAAAGDGGAPARRAVVRWAWRLFRREWRQQALVLALLTVAVAAAIFGASAAYNVAPVPGNAEFGTANHFLRFEVSDPQGLAVDLAYAKERFGTIDVIGHRSVPVPGSERTIELRVQDPHGAYGGPMLALREGRYPTSAGEVAVTDGLARIFGLSIGNPLPLADAEWTVVGLVENPSDLSADFALVAPAADALPASVTILVAGSDDEVFSFRAPSGASTTRAVRPADEDVAAAVGVLGTATVGLLLVALITAASFVVVAQRRLRQLGMLAAIGATEKNLRLVTVANGAAVGAVAAGLGAVAGVAGWVATAPLLETAVGHRIERFDVPWWLIVAGMLLAVVTATAAAWWPARAVARLPITLALSGRPPRPRPVQRSAAVAGLLVAVGVLCLVLARQTNALLLSAGTVATVLGVLLIGPLALRALAVVGARSPIAVRLALRDLARYQARSAAALGAIILALGIPVATVVTATAAEHAASAGNLSEHQLLVRTGTAVESEGDNIGGPFVPDRTPDQLEALAAQVAELAAQLDDPALIPLDVARDPAAPPEPGFGGRPAVTLAEATTMTVGGETRTGYRDVTLLYVASDDLLERYGLDLAAVDPDTEVLTVESGELRYANLPGRPGTQPEVVTNVERIRPSYSSLPGSFLTPDALRRRGWVPVRTGWLIEADQPLTPGQLAAARDLATSAGLTIESRDHQEGLAATRRQATATGMLLALGILAMTVGLIRGEAAGDLRTLTATGATSTTRRGITAATAGALAVLGVILGTLGAYVTLIAGYFTDPGILLPVPVLHLLIIVVGTPLAAVVAGWLLTGREPSALARQPIE